MGTIRFGANIPTSAVVDSVRAALAAEELGFDFISASDHPCGTHPTNETWTMLTWIAASTSRITVVPRVLGAPFRNPVMVAKMAETLARLSGGRLVLGVGAGGSDVEIASMGLPMLGGAGKIRALDEALTIIRGVWSQPAFTYRGQHHQVDAAELEPKPARPIPIWLGTFGDRALALTGRLGDGWIPTLGYAPAGRLRSMRDRVLTAAVDAGRDPGSIDCILNIEIRIDEGANGADDSTVVGSPTEVVERLHELLGLGFNGLNFIALGPDEPDQYRRIAADVLPALRASIG